jgi:hypothetical protein
MHGYRAGTDIEHDIVCLFEDVIVAVLGEVEFETYRLQDVGDAVKLEITTILVTTTNEDEFSDAVANYYFNWEKIQLDFAKELSRIDDEILSEYDLMASSMENILSYDPALHLYSREEGGEIVHSACLTFYFGFVLEV